MNAREMFVCTLAIVVAGTVLMSPVYCTMQRHQRITDVIKAGVDPLTARCAIETRDGIDPECLAAATRGVKP